MIKHLISFSQMLLCYAAGAFELMAKVYISVKEVLTIGMFN